MVIAVVRTLLPLCFYPLGGYRSTARQTRCSPIKTDLDANMLNLAAIGCLPKVPDLP